MQACEESTYCVFQCSVLAVKEQNQKRNQFLLLENMHSILQIHVNTIKKRDRYILGGRDHM